MNKLLLLLISFLPLIMEAELKTTTVVMTASANNAIVSNDKTVGLGPSSLFLGGKNVNTKVDSYLRFPNVSLPSDAVIKSAYIEFYAYAASTTESSIKISGEKANAALYTTLLDNYTSRNYLPTQVSWETTGCTIRSAQKTPDLTELINGMLEYGNKSCINLAFRFEGDQSLPGAFRMYSYSGGSSYYPRLVINYESSVTVISSLVGASNNDAAEVLSTGAVRPSDAYLALGTTNPVTAAYVNKNGIRFQGISIPSTAQIIDAYILFDAYRISTTGVETKISGEIGNSPTFAAVAKNISSRIATNRSIVWKSNVWNKEHLIDRTVNLQPIIDEIRMNGWTSGEQMTFFFEGLSGDGTVYSYNGGSAYQPKLVVEYIDNGSGAQLNTVSEQDKFVRYVSKSENDTYQNVSTGVMHTTSAHLYLGGKVGSELCKSAVRFENISIPATAEIEDAYIEFVSAIRNTNSSQVNIYTEDGNPAEFNTNTYNLTNRSMSSLYEKWDISAWNTTLLRDRTPNLKNLIDSKRLNGWIDNQNICFVFEGNSNGNIAYTQNGSANYQPRLVIRYKDNGNGPGFNNLITDPALMTGLVINELAPQGTAIHRKDWIELYNNSDSDIFITGGVYLSNKKKDKTMDELKNIFIPAHAFVTFIADEAETTNGLNLSFKLKNGGGTVYLSRLVNSKVTDQDVVEYGAIAYDNSYGRVTDGLGGFITFIEPSYNESNSNGKAKIEVGFSKPRGVYEEGFQLTLTSPSADATIRYTLDGASFPSETNGTVYSTPINITKSTVVRTYAYTPTSNTGLIANSYILLDNYDNEVSTGSSSTSEWQNKSSISKDDYALAISKAPIVSISTDAGSAYRELSTSEKVVTFEYLDNHVKEDSDNFYSLSGGKKFGQASSSFNNSGVKFKFSKSRGVTSADYPFFDVFSDDLYPAANKIKSLELKEGEDGPQQGDIWGLGFLRYSESLTMAIQKQMGKYALDTKYVHYIVNGTYRGLKTMREDFNAGNIAEIVGGNEDDFVKVDLQDGNWDSGVISEGDKTIWNATKSAASARDLQTFKKYVDIDDLIKFMLAYMFVDTEVEAQAMYNIDPSVMKMKFNINDTDGAFYKSKSAFAGGGGTSWTKWGTSSTTLTRSLKGPASFFSAFIGTNKAGLNGNLEFRTLVKDEVLRQMQTKDAPLTASNVISLMEKNIEILDPLYKIDAAYMSTSASRYPIWKNRVTEVLGETEDRVTYNIEQWTKCGLVHTLKAVSFEDNNKINDPNTGTLVYYTLDGTDPMGNNGTISGQLYNSSTGLILGTGTKHQIIARPYASDNWGPSTAVVIEANGDNINQRTVVSETSITSTDIQIYPNPVYDILNVDFTGLDVDNTSLQIYSLNGQLCLDKKLTSIYNRVDASKLSPGIYIVRVSNGNVSLMTGKIIKK